VRKGTATATKTAHFQRCQAFHRLTSSNGKKRIPTPNGSVFQYWKKTWIRGGEVPPKKLIEGWSPWASASIIGTTVLPSDSRRWLSQAPRSEAGVPGPASVRYWRKPSWV
jgi:hypothetical protein